MLVEYSFIGSSKHHKCYMALCNDPVGTIEKTAQKYWQSHGIKKGSYGVFEFHRNDDDEFVGLTACKEIDAYALEHILGCFENMLGERCSMPDLVRIVRNFDKRFGRTDDD